MKRTMERMALALVTATVAFCGALAAETNADVVLGYASKWWSEQDDLRPAVFSRCGVSSRKVWKGGIDDAALDGAALFISTCAPSKLATNDLAAIRRFKEKGGKVVANEKHKDLARNIQFTLNYLERNFPSLRGKCAAGHAFLAQVEADNLEARKSFKSVMLEGGPDELRGISCHDPYGPRGEPYGHDPEWHDWDRNCARLKEWGFNALCVNVCDAACAYYQSDVVPTHASVAQRGDALESLKAACRKHGMKFIAWRVCFRRSGWNSSPAFDAWIGAGRGQRDIDGKDTIDMLCPNDSANRRYEVDAFVELARKGVWAVSLDYIRYMGVRFCFCDRCRDLFAKRVGKEKLANWPKCVREDKALGEVWEGFRRETITTLVREIHSAVKAAVPSCRVTASVVRPDWKEAAAQEWETWCREGLVDGVGPMNYYDRGYPQISEIAEELGVEKKFSDAVLMKPTIYPVCWIWDPATDFDLGLRTRYLIDVIREYRRLGVRSFSIFEFTNPFIDMVGMGGK